MTTFAQYGLLIIMSVFLVFHFCVLLKVIPNHMVWGGRLKSDKEMYLFETVSIIINIFFIFIVLIKSDLIFVEFPDMILTIILWIIFGVFLLNTLGNIVSKDKLEKMLFTPVTLILSVLSLILALSN
jgi:hypothetical protein